MKGREFITLLGGAVAWPLAARAQQPADAGDRVPRQHDRPASLQGHFVTAFRQGLRRDAGYS